MGHDGLIFAVVWVFDRCIGHSHVPMPQRGKSAMKCVDCGLESDNKTGFLPASRRRKKRFICLSCLQYRQYLSHKGFYKEFLFGFAISALFLLNANGPWVFLNLYLFFFMLYLSILPHEMGHVLGVFLTRAKLLQISFGQGRLLTAFKIKSVYISFHTVPIEGLVQYVFSAGRCQGLRNALIIAMGPAVNILLFFAIWLAYSDVIAAENFSMAPAPLFTFALANLFTGILNLFPFRTQTQHGPSESDGLSLVRSLLGKSNPLADPYQQMSVQSSLAFNYRDFETQRHLSEKVIQFEHCDIEAKINYTLALAALGELQRAIQISWNLLEDEDLNASCRAMIKSNLSHYYLLLGEAHFYPQALELAESAIQVLPWDLSVRSNYGGVLAVYGDRDTGLELLQDKRFEMLAGPERAEIQCLIAMAYTRKGYQEQAQAHWRLARKLDCHCAFLNQAGP